MCLTKCRMEVSESVLLAVGKMTGISACTTQRNTRGRLTVEVVAHVTAIAVLQTGGEGKHSLLSSS